jgi:hypothetical protein
LTISAASGSAVSPSWTAEAHRIIRITPDWIAGWGLEPGTSYHMTIRRAQN